MTDQSIPGDTAQPEPQHPATGPFFADVAAEDVDASMEREAEATELVETRIAAETVPGSDPEGLDPGAAAPIDFLSAMHGVRVDPDTVAAPARPAD